MDNKIVTFIVPSYNAERYLEKCLSSFLPLGSALEEIEVVIVNDGSNDGTKEIGEKFTAAFPGIFVQIDKENGGHGSTINVASSAARGKYMKVVDADDWVDTENLELYITALRRSSADAVITHFHTVHAVSGKRTAIKTGGVQFGKTYSMAEFMGLGKGALSCCMFHGITYRTEFYRSCGLSLSEKISYEDQEYCTLPFIHLKTVLFLDLFLYEYLIGSADQSVSDANQVARAWQLEQVFWKILRGYKGSEPLSEAASRYILYKLAETLQNYYVTMLIRSKDRKKGRREAARLKIESAAALPALEPLAAFRYRLLRAMHYLHISPAHLEILKKSPLYLWLRAKVR